MPYRVADRLGQVGGGRHAIRLDLQPVMQSLHDGATSRLPHLLAVVGGMAAYLALDDVKLANPCQHLSRQR